MKLYTVVVHNLQMCMKEYSCCLKFRRGDHSTYTFTKRGVAYLVRATPPKRLIGVLWKIHSCSTLAADVHEGIPGCCLLDITPYPFIFHRYLANIPVFQSLNIIVLQAGVSPSEVTHSSSLNQDRIHEVPLPMLNIIIHLDFLQVPYLYSW